MKNYLLLSLSLVVSFSSFAQLPTQVVRGQVFDSETKYPLVGAKVQIFTEDTNKLYRALTDLDGNYQINAVPVGKYELTASIMAYDANTITIEVNSGKQAIFNVPLLESFQDQEEVVVMGRKKGEVINELALISAQQFSVAETDRYAGSRSDPARMASNFAGVGGADDSRNDIVIRGNSPLGVVWKVEGIDIPNPSHFAISGSTGGPVSILNNKMLANSDFFMSAFPAEYGNSTSGVFDLKLRNGNNERHEFTGQFGFLGTEIMAEGPMSKDGKASYLAMGRYSTLSLFQTLGVSIGTDAVPLYGDGALKFNWKLKKGGSLSFFAIGGASDIEILISDQTTYSDDVFGEGDRDQYFGTAMGVGGFTLKKPINERTYLTSTVAFSHERQRSHHDFLIRSIDTTTNSISVDSLYPLMGYLFQVSKASVFVSVNHKINRRHLIKFGLNADMYFFNMRDSALNIPHTEMIDRWDYIGNAIMLQPFVQWKWRVTENMDFTAGIHSQYFSQGNSISPAEPRIGWRLKMKGNQAIFAGAGVHSQTQPMYTYFYHQYDTDGNKVYYNDNMDFSRSLHSGLGYEKSFKKSLNVKTELYYQYVYNVPVTVAPSSFSLINMGSGFARFFPEPLENTGDGYNYGIELTVQKFFDKSFYFLFSATAYDSKYRGSDGVLRNTSYNGTYIANLLGGKEFKINARQSISIGAKVTVAGGRRYGYVDAAQSELLNEVIYMDSLFNERQFKDYFRADVKIGWKLNTKRITHEIGLDLVNILNTRNLLSLAYAPNLADPTQEPIAEKTQLGFLPIFYYRIDFRVGGKKD
ncbi:MAG: TonB-dependent receptor [Crocinitomicaceae bacterium]|nr:TonB-dependent receptor [Crocinitomicaceae bacterium]